MQLPPKRLPMSQGPSGPRVRTRSIVADRDGRNEEGGSSRPTDGLAQSAAFNAGPSFGRLHSNSAQRYRSAAPIGGAHSQPFKARLYTGKHHRQAAVVATPTGCFKSESLK